MSNNCIDITLDIYFNNQLYKDFWEFDDFTTLGSFDMCLYLTNTSLSGVTYKEKIHIEKAGDFKERILYKGYGEEQEGA